jgi:hypothetical protein
MTLVNTMIEPPRNMPDLPAENPHTTRNQISLSSHEKT